MIRKVHGSNCIIVQQRDSRYSDNMEDVSELERKVIRPGHEDGCIVAETVDDSKQRFLDICSGRQQDLIENVYKAKYIVLST